MTILDVKFTEMENTVTFYFTKFYGKISTIIILKIFSPKIETKIKILFPIFDKILIFFSIFDEKVLKVILLDIFT